MLRTALLSAALLAGGYGVANGVTHGFQAWTEEGARRLEVAQVPVAVPAVAVQGPSTGRADLRALLANGRDVTVVEFIYTRCETLCLAAGSVFQQMQAQLQEKSPAERVRLLSVSFDARDGQADLAAYARRMRADPRWWRFVRASDAAGTQRLLDAFRVVVVPSGSGDYEHNAALLVVNRDGRLLRIFDLAQHQLALDYAQHLAQGGAP
jgi:protein SCO1/2